MSSRNGSKFWGPIIRSHLHSCHVKYFRSSCKIPLRRLRAYHNCSRLGKLVSVPNTASNTAHSSDNIWYYSSRERLGIQAANSKRKRSFRKYLSTATRVPCSSVQYKKGNTSRRWSRMNQTILDKHQTVALLLKKTSAMRVFWTHFFHKRLFRRVSKSAEELQQRKAVCWHMLGRCGWFSCATRECRRQTVSRLGCAVLIEKKNECLGYACICECWKRETQ